MEAEVEAESRIHELQLRVEELEKLREADQAELAALRESEQTAASQLDSVKEENSRLAEQAREAQEISKNALQAKEKAEAEKRDLLDALARSDSDKQQLENNLAELQAAHSATQASLRSMEASYSSAIENERSYKLRLQGLEGELSISRKDRDWNHEELLRVTEESTKDRREKNAQISTLQAQLDAAVQTSESATTSLTALKTSHAALESRLTEAQARIAELTSQLADSEASFRAEISTAQRLTDLLEKREVDTKTRLDEVEKEWQTTREEIEETKQAYEAELEKEKARGDALEERVHEMRDFADRLAATGGPSLGNISSITQDKDVFGAANGSPRSPSVSNVSFRVQKAGGMSYTEVYSSYIKMQEALVFEKAESKRLSECLNEILAEIQDRAPLLREQRNEYERAVAENNDLSVALAKSLEEKEAVIALAEARLRQIEEKDREAAISAQQLEDTARQVRTLTRQVAILQDPTILERSGADEQDLSQMDEDSESADTYISQNLVTFKSIDQLQQQNQNLLKIVRQLGKKMEAEEQAVRDRIGRAENSAVEEAHDLILSLKEEVEAQRAQMGAYQRERDMLRQVLKNRGQAQDEDPEESGNHTSTSQSGSNVARAALEDVQRNFEAYKREMIIDNQSLRDDLSSARKEVSQLHIQVARSKAEKEYAEERLKTLRNSNERIESELAGMSKRNLELQSNMARLDDATRRVSEEVYDLKGSLDRSRHEAMMLKAEKEVWKNVEARLTEDNASLAKERSHMSDLMRNLQAMHNELDRTGNEARQRLEEHVARLSKELEITKDRLSQEVESGRQIALRREVEGRELQEKIEKVTTEYHETREAYLSAKNASERAVERSEAMQRQVAAYEEKLAVYEGRRGQTGEGASSLSREQQLETQLADIRAELGTAKMDAEQARAHVEQYKSIAQAHEHALAELNATYDEYRRSMEAGTAQRDEEISALQERVQSLTNDLTASSDENSQLHRQLQNQKTQFEQEQQANLDTIANLRHFETQIEAVRTASKKDLDAQVRRANEAHDRYQAEIVAHAEDVKALSVAREQLAGLQSSLREATHKAETAHANLSSSEASWVSQRENLQKEIDEQQKRCEDLVAQNSILHDHLENVSRQAALIKQVPEGQEAVNGGDVAEPPSEAKTVEELHAVIRYVRRERDVAELRLHLSKQEESRMRQQLEQTNKRLDELTATLARERQQASEQSASAVQHAELMEKIQSLNLLRESNETLRREAEAYLERVKGLETSLRETELELSPLREQLRVLQAEIEAKDRNIAMLEEDNARWKTRTQQILQKYERIDPAELASLKEELEKVKASLAEAEKERDAATHRAEAIQVDFQDASTRAEANHNRFKGLQKIAREHRDNHAAAQAEFEKQKAELQAEVERLTAAKAQLEEQAAAAQSSTAQASEADGEALKQVEAQRDDLQRQLQSLKEELEKAQQLLNNAKGEDEAARRKLEEDMALQTRRNTALLNDNKKFRAQIQELNAKVSASVEEEVQKRLAALPQPASEEGGAVAVDQEAIKAQLSELEARLTAEKESAIQVATQETEKRLQEEFAQEKARLTSQAAIGSGSEADAESIQKRIDEAASAKIAEAIQAKEAELAELKKSQEQEIKSAIAAKEAEVNGQVQKQVDQAKNKIETTAQTRINNLAKQHKEAIEKLQKSHDQSLKTAVEEGKAAATNQEAGEITSTAPSQEDIDKAVKEALVQKEQEHQKALADKVAEAKEKAKTEFDLKSKLRDTQIAALRKETASLKARLAQTSATDTATSPQIPAIPVAAPTETSTPAPNGTPIKGLSIAGRSQSQGTIAQSTTPAASTGMSIAGSAASATTTPVRGRGRGRGLARGGAPGAGRGRGNIVGTALNAATDGGAKRAREDESADSEAKRRKDGES